MHVRANFVNLFAQTIIATDEPTKKRSLLNLNQLLVVYLKVLSSVEQKCLFIENYFKLCSSWKQHKYKHLHISFLNIKASFLSEERLWIWRTVSSIVEVKNFLCWETYSIDVVLHRFLTLLRDSMSFKDASTLTINIVLVTVLDAYSLVVFFTFLLIITLPFGMWLYDFSFFGRLLLILSFGFNFHIV